MISIQDCWTCGKVLSDFHEEFPFHCNFACQAACKYWNFVPTGENPNEEEKKGPPKPSVDFSNVKFSLTPTKKKPDIKKFALKFKVK